MDQRASFVGGLLLHPWHWGMWLKGQKLLAFILVYWAGRQGYLAVLSLTASLPLSSVNCYSPPFISVSSLFVFKVFYIIIIFIFGFLPFLGLLPWHMEAPRLGFSSEL